MCIFLLINNNVGSNRLGSHVFPGNFVERVKCPSEGILINIIILIIFKLLIISGITTHLYGNPRKINKKSENF